MVRIPCFYINAGRDGGPAGNAGTRFVTSIPQQAGFTPSCRPEGGCVIMEAGASLKGDGLEIGRSHTEYVLALDAHPLAERPQHRAGGAAAAPPIDRRPQYSGDRPLSGRLRRLSGILRLCRAAVRAAGDGL